MPEPQMTVEREFAFDSALAHYYQGLSAADAAKTFLNACADALIESLKNGEKEILSLQASLAQASPRRFRVPLLLEIPIEWPR
jgi:hypothetical protein